MNRQQRVAHVVALVVITVCVFAMPVFAQDCPQLLGRWPYGPASAVAVSGSLAFVGSGTTMLVLDVSTPSSPQLLGDVTLPDLVYGIAVGGSHAYVANGMAGLRVIDVSNPAAPVEVGVSDVTNEGALDVAVAGSHAYVAYGTLGLRVIDVSEPSLPGVVGAIDTPGTARGVAVAGSYAFVADGSSGCASFRSRTAAPVDVGPSTPRATPTGSRWRRPRLRGGRNRAARHLDRQPGSAGRGAGPSAPQRRSMSLCLAALRSSPNSTTAYG
jgi:hypothetical protein